MKTRIVTLLLLFALIFCNISAIAQEAVELDITYLLKSLNIMSGDPNGDMRLSETITRAEFTKVAVAASIYRNSVATNMTISPFSDVPYSHWAAPYIKIALSNKLIAGYADSTFKPDQDVVYEEAITVVLKLLGYTNEDFGSTWPYGQVGLAKSLELSDNIDKSVGQPLDRGDVATLIFNMLCTKSKGTNVDYMNTFKYQTYKDVTLIATTKEAAYLTNEMLYTSNGTYTIDNTFDHTSIGKKGEIMIKDSEDVVLFRPYKQTITSYKVTGIIGSDLVLGGKIYNIDDNLTVYYKTQKLTYADTIALAKEAYSFVTYANESGEVEYACLFAHQNSGEEMGSDAQIKPLDKYIVYAKLDNILITYKDDALEQLSIPDSTVTYQEETQKTTFATAKSKLEMGDLIYVKRDEKNEIEYISVETGNLRGPFTVKSNGWQAQLGANNADMAIMRNGVKVTSQEILGSDIIYYAQELNLVLAYSKKITGIYETATPNKDLPTAVTISGISYELEGVNAFQALSSHGSFQYGDTVTLLIGKDGKVADAVSPEEVNFSVYGFLTNSGSKEFVNTNEEKFSYYYASVILPDGTAYEYLTDRNYDSCINCVVQVKFEDGLATVTQQNEKSDLYGVFNAKNRTIEGRKISSDVQILDISTTDISKKAICKSIFLQRMDEVNLRSDDVLFYNKNANDEIDTIFLNDVTGDGYQYGVVTKAKNNYQNMNSNGSYTYDINGTVQSLSTSSYTFAIASGQPAKFSIISNKVDSIIPLSSIKEDMVNFTNTYIETKDAKYLLSSTVVAYKKTYDYQYLVTPLSEIIGNEKLDIHAFYDSKTALGGRVRIIIATDKP